MTPNVGETEPEHPRSSGPPVSRRTRRRLLRCTVGLRRECEGSVDQGWRFLPLAPPDGVDEPAVGEAVVLLRRLESLLADPVHPCMASAASEIWQLVGGDRWSPLYYPERSSELPAVVARVLAAVE